MIPVKRLIVKELRNILKDLTNQYITPTLEHPKDERHGDYSSNIVLTIFSSSKFKVQSSKFRTPLDLARQIVEKLRVQSFDKAQDKGSRFKVLEKLEAVKPGFINFWLSKDYLTTLMICILKMKDKYGRSKRLENKKIMVEFAHPNTHKEMHIGHMRTLITGEALARIFEEVGAKVFRANYQGDIGPHVAKAIFGIQNILEGKGLTIDKIEDWSNKEKAHFLGEAYVRGNREYEKYKDKIDQLNEDLYEKDENIKKLYQRTREWSLDYYDELYRRFYTKFDKLFFESDMVECGKDIVLKNVGRIFVKDNEAIIFPGEKYGLHTRVFITKAGNPTYEGKEMCNAFAEHEAFPFDKKIHVVASEQKEYFQVVFKALELIDPEKFKDRQYHIPMGMVHLASGKMSSRTGDVLTVDSLIDRVKEKVNSLVEAGKIKKTGREDVAEEVAIGAIKYSVIRVDTKQDVAFDIEKSVSLDGNSGSYLQYTFARTQSVLRKSEIRNPKPGSRRYPAKHETNPNFQNPNVQNVSPSPAPSPLEGEGRGEGDVSDFDSPRFAGEAGIRYSNLQLEPEELSLLRSLHRFPEVVEEAAGGFAPNLLCNYLFDLAQKFNLFYQKHKILESEERDFRLALTQAVGQIIKNGLYLLGIEAPERM